MVWHIFLYQAEESKEGQNQADLSSRNGGFCSAFSDLT